MVAVVPDVSGGSRKSLEVVAVVPDVPGSSRRSLEVVNRLCKMKITTGKMHRSQTSTESDTDCSSYFIIEGCK